MMHLPELATWDQWRELGYHVIKGMKAKWVFLEEYGKEVAVFHKGQVQKTISWARYRQDYFREEHDSIEYEYGSFDVMGV